MRREEEGAFKTTCGESGAVRDSDMAARCRRCGRGEVRKTFQAILDNPRGNQLSIQAMRVVWLCRHCDAEKLRRYLNSNVPLPPGEMPVHPK